MTDRDPAVQALLDRTPPPDVGPPDWDDVVRRLERGTRAPQPQSQPQPQPRPRRRRLVLGIAVALVLTALLVNPAFGLGERLADLFRGSPAPEQVRRDLAELNPPREVEALFADEPRVLADEARGVVALETSAGTAYLWVAPTDAGGWCRYVQTPDVPVEGGSVGGAGIACEAVTVEGDPADRGPLDLGMASDATSGLVLVEGRTGPPTVALRLEYADGGSEDVPIVDGFFLAEVRRDAGPATLVALDADGAAIRREPLAREDEAAGLGESRTSTASADAGGLVGEPLIRMRTRAGRAVLAGRRSGGARCYAVDAVGGQWESCPATTGGAAAERQNVAHVQPVLLLAGFVPAGTRSAELRYGDGSRVPLRLVRGYFLLEVPPGRWQAGRLPERVVARDGQGAVLAEARVRPLD